jgi:hypothetical protein
MWELFCKGRKDVKEHATIYSKEEGMTCLKSYFLQTKKSSLINARSPSIKYCRDKSTR